MQITKRFILVDDDIESNILCKFVIRKTIGETDIQYFSMPERALAYIRSEYAENGVGIPAILLLEINTATMTGWEFLNAFSALPSGLRKQFTIFILTSSIDEGDKEHVLLFPEVSGYLEKPLTREMVLRITRKNFKKEGVKNSLLENHHTGQP